MASYDYRTNEDLEIANRFRGDDIAHQELWGTLPWSVLEVGANEFLDSQLAQRVITQPRLFISHKSTDINLALQVVRWCSQSGLDYWLDVFDPRLAAIQPSSPSYAVTVAAIIEMALLNCTHVIVLYTDDAATSRWVPYEYGRVKIPNLRSLQAAAWHKTAITTLPEYLHLGKICSSESAAEQWVKSI